MKFSKPVVYFLVVLFGFALLFPGAAFQHTFGHGTQYTPQRYGVGNNQEVDRKQCTLVNVKAEITKITLDNWYISPDAFNDINRDLTSKDAEIQIMAKFYQPGHENFKGKKTGDLQIDDWFVPLGEKFPIHKIGTSEIGTKPCCCTPGPLLP